MTTPTKGKNADLHTVVKAGSDGSADVLLLHKFVENPGLVDTWKALSEFSLLRKNPDNLETLNKVKNKFVYNGKAGQQALEEIFSGHQSAQKFIDNLGKAEEIFDGVGVKQWSGIKSASEARLVNDAGVVVGKVDNGVFTVTVAKGSRPTPTSYLTQSYIDNHLSRFLSEGTGSRIVLKENFNTFGVGKPDAGKTEFISLGSDIDKLLLEAKGNITEMSEALGIPVEKLQGGLVRIDFKITTRNKIDMPSGNEFGTNEKWIPGGKLPKGSNEVVVRTEGMTEGVDYFISEVKF